MTLIDVLYENGNPTGIAKTKPEIHEQGLWHRAAHIWIYNSSGDVLLQLRAKDKDSHPGLWDISAAGHVDSGESSEQAAVREMREEIGLIVPPDQLKLVDTIKISAAIPEIGWQNNEIDSIYLFKFDGDVSSLSMDDGEVEKLEFVPIDKFEQDINDAEACKKYVPAGDYYKMVIRKIRANF